MNKPPLSEGQLVERLKKHHERRLLDRIRVASRQRDKQLPALSLDIAREWIRATQKPHPSLTEQRVNEILQEIWEESKNAPTEMIWTGSNEDLEKFLEKFSQL